LLLSGKVELDMNTGGVYYGWRLRRFRVQVGGSLPMAERLGARKVAST
jgi:hypothetical protein